MLTLLVCFENAHLMAYLESHKGTLPQHRVVVFNTCEQLKAQLALGVEKSAIALISFNKDDKTPFNEAAEAAQEKEIPVIALTDFFDENIRKDILSKNVCDYFIKNELNTYHHLDRFIDRLFNNHRIKVLVVDDSATSLFLLKFLLRNQQYQVLEAKNGNDALKVLKENLDIQIAVIDYYMPEMNGFELTTHIRKIKSKEELAVIGMSATSGGPMTARFLKEGANDFLSKPFSEEEFYCRIEQNVEYLERINSLKNLSHRDHLTGLYNRRYFFEIGEKIYHNACRGNTTISIALVDVDNFKKINDTYSHAAGDMVLKTLADIFAKNVRKSDIVARFGGEEFLVLFVDMAHEHASGIMEKLRKTVVNTAVVIDEETSIHFTFSGGLTLHLNHSLEDMIHHADTLLYEAKKNGKNQIVMD